MAVRGDFLVELRGFELLTSAVRALKRFTAPPLPTRDPESAKFGLKSLAGDDLNPQRSESPRCGLCEPHGRSESPSQGWLVGRKG
jgi:hypothetical protein